MAKLGARIAMDMAAKAYKCARSATRETVLTQVVGRIGSRVWTEIRGIQREELKERIRKG